MKILSDAAIRVIGAMETAGSLAVLPAGQLDRDLYVEVNKAMEAIGGKWNRKAKAHVFDGDPRDAIDQIVMAGGFTSAKDEFGFFQTPAPVVELMMKTLFRIAPVPRMHAFEPSAGSGVLADELVQNWPFVHVCEVQPKLAHALRDSGKYATVMTANFLDLDPRGAYDAIAMNPPFARQQDIDHVLHAWNFLATGGALVSVMSAGALFRENRKAKEFRQFMGAAWMAHEPLPDHSFRESGTDVRTILVHGVKR